MKVVAIIPARLESQRLPEKVLLPLGEKKVIDWVYDALLSISIIDEVVIATDAEKVKQHCEIRDMNCVLTCSSHVSGTDRVAEAAEGLDADIVINVQGDEPFINPSSILALVELMKNEDVKIGTLKQKITTSEELFDFNTVKVVCDDSGKCLYFSRQAIPSVRDLPYREWLDFSTYHRHIGVYGFKKDSLLHVAKLSEHPLEKAEKLEQLRWMANGLPIHTIEVFHTMKGIDTPEDLEEARRKV